MTNVVRRRIATGLAACFLSVASAASADVQVNSVDNNATNLDNLTTESETYVARHGSLAVVGYNTSRQAGLLGIAAWTSLSGYAYSTNGGNSFTDGGFVPAGAYSLQGDPTLQFDTNGTLYYGSLLEQPSTGNSYIGVNASTSTSPSVTFGSPVVLSGASSTDGGFEDKEFLAVDTTGGTYNGRVYVGWSDYPPSGNPQAQFAASSSTSPLAFSPTVAIAPSSGAYQHGVIPVVGPDGTLYVAWSQLTSTAVAASATINMVKSTNGGGSFVNPDPTDPNASKTVATFTSTPGDLGTGGESLRTRSFPFLAIDNTPAGSPTRGNMYVVFAGQPSATAPPRAEIYFTASTNGGKTWSAPRDITSGPAATLGADPTSNDNWLPSISVSPVTGHIKVLLYSRREDPANQKIRVYEAGSTDAGMTWYNRTYSAVDFAPSDGYDPLLVPSYMGDYLWGFADANGLLGAWGDTRNLCAPPAGAAAPCSPAGRGDQDVWSHAESDATGVDMAITPWGYVTGVGPTWESPDIFVVNASNVQVNAQKGVINALRARVRNLGSANATGAVVRFRYAPWYSSIPDSAFKLIGTVTVNAAAGAASQLVPINWDLTNLNDTNGGVWPAPISTFDHFCVRVDITYPSDINLSNNDAQTNFFDVDTGTAPLAPIHFIIGNPLAETAKIQLVTEPLAATIRSSVKVPIVTVPAKPVVSTALIVPRARVAHVAAPPTLLRGTMTFQPKELQVGTITLTRPPASVTAHLTHDIVVNVDSVVNGKVTGGFSIRLARANTRAAAPKALPVRIVSKQVAESIPPVEPSPKVYEFTAPLAATAARQSILDYFASSRIAVSQNDTEHGIISSKAVPLSNAALLNAIPAEAHKFVPAGATAKYFVSVRTTPGEGATAHVVVSVRIIVLTPQDLDSPLGGRLVPSNGTLEQSFVSALTTRLK
ncbi:MAG: sialidase family protein [Vulcanimicrobiaceae bacterium]